MKYNVFDLRLLYIVLCSTTAIFLTLKPTSCTGVKGFHIYVYIFLTKLILTAKKNLMSPKHFISLQLRDSIRVYHCKYSNFTVS